MNFNFDLAFNSQANNSSSFYSGLGFNSRHPPLATFKDQIFKEDLYFSDEEENGGERANEGREANKGRIERRDKRQKRTERSEKRDER